MRCLAGVVVALLLGLSAAEARPRIERKLIRVDPAAIGNVVNSKTIFLNRCRGGCQVTESSVSDSRKNNSSIGGGTLSAFGQSDTVWNGTVACVKQTFSRFNVEVTDVDPGPYVDHFEVMFGGDPGNIGLPSGIGGIAEYACSGVGSCDPYVPNALVFVFDVWGGDVNEICATAAQEIAHTWSMDHVVDPSDPMTYAPYSGMRNFKDGVTCGSDCDYTCGTGYCNAFGIQCSGSGATGSHVCMSTGTTTQNDVQMVMNLFGPAGAPAPTLTLKNPAHDYSGQKPGFAIEAECSSADGVIEVVLSVDGERKQTKTAAPYTFTAPTLSDGLHRISVLCGTSKQAISIVQRNVLVGAACANNVCAAGFVCYDGVCIAGPDSSGGLGATCTNSAECKAGGECASDGETMACTIPCDLDDSRCPDGFGCLAAGTMGVCWPGVDDGGCCSTGGGPGSMLLAFGIAAVWITRRRRK